MLRKCLNSTDMVKSRCVSSNRHRETIIALHGPYNGHLEHVFVLQNDPLNLQNEDSLRNAAKMFKLNPDSKQSSCFFKKAPGNNYCTVRTVYNDHLEHVFVLQNDPLNLQNEDSLRNAAKMFKLNPDSKQSSCFFKKAPGNNYCTVRTVYNDHLEHVFVLQNDPLNLQNEDSLRNAAKMFKLNPDSKQSSCFFKKAPGNNYCTVRTVYNDHLEHVFVLQNDPLNLQNEDSLRNAAKMFKLNPDSKQSSCFFKKAPGNNYCTVRTVYNDHLEHVFVLQNDPLNLQNEDSLRNAAKMFKLNPDSKQSSCFFKKAPGNNYCTVRTVYNDHLEHVFVLQNDPLNLQNEDSLRNAAKMFKLNPDSKQSSCFFKKAPGNNYCTVRTIYNDHLEHVFVLQNDPLNLQNEDSLRNAAKMFKLNPDSKQSSCFFKKAPGNNYCTVRTVYNDHLEHVFVLQNDPLNLQNEDSLRNAAKMFKLNPDSKQSSCFFKKAPGNNYCTVRTVYNDHLEHVFVLQNDPLNLQNEDSLRNAAKMFKLNPDSKQSSCFFKKAPGNNYCTVRTVYNDHLEHVFVLQNDPLNLQNEDSLRNAAKMFKLNPDSKQSSCFFKKAPGNNYCTVRTVYNDHLEHVFVLQNDPLNLQNEDSLRNAAKMFKLNPDSKQSSCFFKKAPGNNYCTVRTVYNDHLDHVFVLQNDPLNLQNEDMFQMTIIRSVKGNNCFSGAYLRKRNDFLPSWLSVNT